MGAGSPGSSVTACCGAHRNTTGEAAAYTGGGAPPIAKLREKDRAD